MNLEGRLIASRYELIEKVGNGGMATVYKAKDHTLNRFVAVKILRDEFTTDNEFIKRFNSEAQAVASLSHPNIVSVYDVGHEGDLYYIVMELVQGKTLKEVITEDGALSWKWSVNVAIQIASALETAHKNNIIHRDIKPHNIIITEEGVAKVTDFGIAKAVSNSTITAFGTTIGSVHYFSPEHARGGFTDAKSDLYSLGIVMYEMLTGKVPFDADTPVSIALMHMQQEAKEPIQLNPSVPVAVNKIVVKAMQKDPNMRYVSASEMLRDLKLALKNPEGNFVVMKDEENDFPTQKIPTMYHAEEEKTAKGNKNKKENKFISFIKKHKILSFIVGAIILFFLTIGITYFGLKLTAVKDVQIPNLENVSQEEAKRLVEEANLVYTELEAEYSPTVPEGFVMKQEPAYIDNYKIKEKSEIKVVISKGQELTTVPKVVGKTKEEAITALEEANLKAEVIEETSKKVEEGYVISQEIEANKQVNAGETVKIHVSMGVEQISVPNVLGKTEEEARKLITDAKLKVKVVTVEDTTKTSENGKVIKQDVDANNLVDEGTEITITVNQIIEKKNAKITINVKSITNGYDEDANTIIAEKDKKVDVVLKADSKTVFSQSSVDKNETNLTAEITGTGRVSLELVVGGNTRTYTLDFNSESTYTFK